MAKPKAIVLLSGGLDSTTLLYRLQYEDYEVTALSVQYGQRHSRELQAAQEVAQAAHVERVHLDLAHQAHRVFEGARSSQVGEREAVPHGHYAAENMKLTIVPNRNMLLLAWAGALAVSRGAEAVAYAAHAGDHAIYPDCRPSFMQAMQIAMQQGTGWPDGTGTVDLIAPFAFSTKADIVRFGRQLHVPFHLTYSCYEGRQLHCGLCGTCVERKEAFTDAGVEDPTEYEV